MQMCLHVVIIEIEKVSRKPRILLV